MKLFQYKAILFDLDGTLIDTAKDVHVALNQTADELSLKNAELHQVKEWIDFGLSQLIEKFIGDETKIKDEIYFTNTKNLFLENYNNIIGEHGDLAPNIKSLLVQLLADGKKIACITNKSYQAADFLLQINFIRQFFHIVCSGDNVKRKKPDPWSIEYCSKTFGVEIKDCVMIGDSINDIKMAKAANCDSIAVTSGYQKAEKLTALNPTNSISDFNELL